MLSRIWWFNVAEAALTPQNVDVSGAGGGPARSFGLIGCNPLVGKECTIQHLAGLFVGIFEFLLALAVVLALAVIVWGGFQMVKGWFEEEPEGAYKEGKQTIRRGIWGFVLVLGAFLIVETLLFIFAGPDRGINYFFQQAFGS